MRVLAVSRMFPRSGNPVSGVFVLEQLKSIKTIGIDVSVVVPTAHGPLSRVVSEAATLRSDVDGVPVEYVPYVHLPLRLTTRFEIWSLMRRLVPAVRAEHSRCRIDVLHAHQLFPTGYATAIIARNLGIPSVCTAHGSDVHTHPLRNRGIARYTQAALRTIDRVVAVSQDLAERIVRLEARSAPTTVVYSGIDPRRFTINGERLGLRSKLGLPERGVGICFVGRLVATKGVIELLDAFRTLRGRGLDVWLVLVGSGPLQGALASAAREFGGRLVIAGSMPHDRVPDYLRAADVFALPSHGEGVPVAMLEAMACGLPVVATAVGGIPEVMLDESTGFLVRNVRDGELAERLARLVSNKGLRDEMGRAARLRIDEAFHWNHGAVKLCELYSELIAGQNVTAEPIADTVATPEAC